MIFLLTNGTILNTFDGNKNCCKRHFFIVSYLVVGSDGHGKKVSIFCLFGSQRGDAPFFFLRKVNHLRTLNNISTNGAISNAFNASIAANGMVAWIQNVRHLKDKN